MPVKVIKPPTKADAPSEPYKNRRTVRHGAMASETSLERKFSSKGFLLLGCSSRGAMAIGDTPSKGFLLSRASSRGAGVGIVRAVVRTGRSGAKAAAAAIQETKSKKVVLIIAFMLQFRYNNEDVGHLSSADET